MQEVLKALQESQIFYLATVDGDKPAVRPFGFAMEYDGNICLCTGNKKAVFHQMKANPQVEISATLKNGSWFRIRAKAEFITTDASQQAAIDALPMLGKIYSVGDGVFEVFALKDGEAIFYGQQGPLQTIKF